MTKQTPAAVLGLEPGWAPTAEPVPNPVMGPGTLPRPAG